MFIHMLGSNCKAPFINGHSNLQLQVGAAPFIKGATLQLEPNTYNLVTSIVRCNGMLSEKCCLQHIRIGYAKGYIKVEKLDYKCLE